MSSEELNNNGRTEIKMSPIVDQTSVREVYETNPFWVGGDATVVEWANLAFRIPARVQPTPWTYARSRRTIRFQTDGCVPPNLDPTVADDTDLHERNQALYGVVSEVRSFVERRSLAAVLARVTQITNRLFGHDWRLTLEHDPEIADESYLVFRVRATGNFAEIHQRANEWHSAMVRFARPNADAFRLGIDVMNDR